jgi:hypothetical protein
MYELPKQPRNVDQIVGSTIELFKTSVVPLLPLSLLTALAAVIEGGYVLIYVPPQTRELVIFDPRYLAVVGVTLVISLLAYGAMWALADFITRGERMSTGRALSIGVRALPTMVGSAVLFLLAVIIGCMLFLVPGVIVSVSLFLFGPLIILERKGVIESLHESHRLVTGHWWHTAILQTIGFVAILAPQYLVLRILDVALGSASLDESTGVGLVLVLSTLALVTAITTPAMIALMLEIYRDLKLRQRSAAPGA